MTIEENQAKIVATHRANVLYISDQLNLAIYHNRPLPEVGCLKARLKATIALKPQEKVAS